MPTNPQRNPSGNKQGKSGQPQDRDPGRQQQRAKSGRDRHEQSPQPQKDAKAQR